MIRAWIFIAALLAVLVAFACDAVTAAAFPLGPSIYDTRGAFSEAILSVLASRPVYKDDRSPDVAEEKRAQLELVAPAIARASGGDKFIAALLIAVGDAETHWSLRIWKNQCRKCECDHGRSRGPWQKKKSTLVTAEQWELMGQPTELGTLVGAQQAAQLLRYGVHVCGQLPECVLRVYAGKSPRSEWDGLNERLATFASAARRL